MSETDVNEGDRDDREPRDPGGEAQPAESLSDTGSADAATPTAPTAAAEGSLAAEDPTAAEPTASSAPAAAEGAARPSHLAPLRRLPGALFAALRRALGAPGVLALFLVLNLGAAALVVMPLRSLLAAELDSNLYGDAMQSGASWRWFDTVERRHPRAVGNYDAWTALFSDDGVGLADLKALSGPPAAIALAALLLFLLHGPLHVGWLAAARSRLPPTAAKVAGQAVGYAPAAILLSLLAGLSYAAVYAVFFVAPADLLARLAEGLQSERLHLVFIAARLAVTLLLVAVVKVFFDLAKVGLAEGGHWGLGGAFLLAGRQTVRHGVVYLLLYALLAVAALLVAALWWVVSGPLVPETWLGLAILFVLHQLLVALRIGLRLAGLRAVQDLVL